MRINLSEIDQTQFMVHQHILGGQVVHLVQPQFMGCQWNQQNKILRSSVWDSNGELISAGFCKFTNWGEKPDHFPVPTSLKDTTIVEKIDGSLLIVSKWRGQYILRTRGTVDAFKLDNGHELELFKQNVLPALEAEYGEQSDEWIVSFLFEWVSPNQRIILNYGDSSQWFLVGQVWHDNYALASQETLDVMAQRRGLLRPPSYTFPTIEDLMSGVELWKGKEGVCVYSNDGQTIHKVKAASYLFLHRMKQELGSVEKVIDVWIDKGKPSFHEFETFITSNFDWELWKMIMPDVSRICDAWKESEKIISGMRTFITTTLLPLPARREQAAKVLSSYGTTGRSSMVFKLLDGKPLGPDDDKRLLYQCLKS